MLNKFLFRKTDIRQLAFLRIAIGLWFFIDYFVMMLNGYMKAAYIDTQVHFPFYGFEWIRPWPAEWMYVHYVVLSLSALGITLGYRYRLSLIIFLIAHQYVFMLDIVYTLNKYYMFSLFTFLLLFADAHRFWSLDVRRNPSLKREWTPMWTVFIFQFMVGMIYTYSGISKINPDWLFRQQPLVTFMRARPFMQALPDDLYYFAVYIFIYVGVFFDLSIVWWLSWRKSNWIANFLVACFHLLNLVVLHIGSLSIFMIFCTWGLFPTVWLKKRIHKKDFGGELAITDPTKRKWVLYPLAAFMFIQLLIPHRHYLTGNNVNWTEKGHRFSWRLMTRTKQGSNSMFYVTDPKSGETWAVNPYDYLSRRQYFKMSAETDLVLVFAYYLEEEWRKKGYEDVVVKARIRTRLNRRKVQDLVPPDLDLTTCKRTLLRDNISTKLNPVE